MDIQNLQGIDLLKEKFNYTYISKNESQTKELAKYIASKIKKGDILALNGELGAGKTTFMQGIANFFNIEDKISSPTFTIVNEYSVNNDLNIYHFDVYRITDCDEFEDTIGTEYFENGISIIEWADIIKDILPNYTIHIDILKSGADNERILKIWR